MQTLIYVWGVIGPKAGRARPVNTLLSWDARLATSIDHLVGIGTDTFTFVSLLYTISEDQICVVKARRSYWSNRAPKY